MMDPVRAYYRDNPLMVSSPFGGVDGFDDALLEHVWRRLGFDVAGRRVLDVGCGRGFLEACVTRRGGAYVGMDFVAARTGFPLALGDAAHLPFRDGAFGALCCIDAFEHFPSALRAAKEFRRVLGSGGRVFLSVPNYANVAGLVKRYCERFGGYERDSWAPFRQWQPQELEHAVTPAFIRRVFRQAGFGRLRCMGHGAEVGLGLFPWMAHPKMPEAIQFRLQRISATIGPAAARVWPGASLHVFWRIDL